MKLNANEMAIRILATGKVQVVDARNTRMAQIAVEFRKNHSAKGDVVKHVGSAVVTPETKKVWITLTESTSINVENVTVDGVTMPRAIHGEKYGPRTGQTVWVVSKLQHADGSFIAFTAEILDARNL